ncbi:hypothetical protein MJO29_001573 [Puccinia striiformis f. sp. tritici]|nr:hypothetical protein MJO29_001573 [Puccinia striiformis f. sp. tritici]
MNLGRSRKTFYQTTNGYETCIQYLEEVVHLLLARTNSPWPPLVSSAPQAGSFRFLADRGLVPLLSKATAISLAVSRSKHNTLTRTPSSSGDRQSCPSTILSLNSGFSIDIALGKNDKDPLVQPLMPNRWPSTTFLSNSSPTIESARGGRGTKMPLRSQSLNRLPLSGQSLSSGLHQPIVETVVESHDSQSTTPLTINIPSNTIPATQPKIIADHNPQHHPDHFDDIPSPKHPTPPKSDYTASDQNSSLNAHLLDSSKLSARTITPDSTIDPIFDPLQGPSGVIASHAHYLPSISGSPSIVTHSLNHLPHSDRPVSPQTTCDHNKPEIKKHNNTKTEVQTLTRDPQSPCSIVISTPPELNKLESTAITTGYLSVPNQTPTTLPDTSNSPTPIIDPISDLHSHLRGTIVPNAHATINSTPAYDNEFNAAEMGAITILEYSDAYWDAHMAPDLAQAALRNYDDIDNYLKLANSDETVMKRKKKKQKKKKTNPPSTSGNPPSTSDNPVLFYV